MERHSLSLKHCLRKVKLTLLTKDMTKPNLTMREFEAMLGYPKETLEFTIWYLKENDCLRPGDNGAYSISARGVEFYERTAMETQDLVVLPSTEKRKELAPMK